MSSSTTAQELNLTDALVFEREVQRRLPESPGNLSLLIVDMRSINEVFNRSDPVASRALLSNIARLLQRICRDQDRVYRIGDFTFGVVLADVSSSVQLQLAAEKIVRLYDSALRDLDIPYKAGIAIGIANYPEHCNDARDLIRKASVAVEASRTREDPYVLYRPDALETLSLKWNLQEEVGVGITSRDFELHYQPKVSLATGQVTGAEALLRWTSESHGSVPPDVVIAVAREIGRIGELTQSLLTNALRHSSEWPGQDELELSLSVNLDADSLKDPEITDAVATSLSIWGAHNHNLMLEITETALVTDSNFELLQKFRSLGVGLSIDDFGTGFSSLSYFKKIPASELKIDKAFIQNMLESEADRKIVETIIELAHRFDMQVVAEGLESEDQVNLARELGCDTGQGFYFSKALPHDEFCRWLAAYHRNESQR